MKNLQKLLGRSRAAKLKAIRKVTREPSGPHTPGIDGAGCDTPQKRLTLLQEGLSLSGYRPQPVKRCYRPINNGGHRPLGRTPQEGSRPAGASSNGLGTRMGQPL